MSFDFVEMLAGIAVAIVCALVGARGYRRRADKGSSKPPRPPQPPKSAPSTVADETEEKVTNAIADGNDVLEDVDKPANGDPATRWRRF